jgi:hypothetical protein
MAFVSVPKDLTKVKTKIIFNLTKRQLICIGIAAIIGVPFYFATREVLGTSNAATGMVLLMLPAFFFAMYEKDGLPLERVLLNMIRVKFLNPGIRLYEIETQDMGILESDLEKGKDTIERMKKEKDGME